MKKIFLLLTVFSMVFASCDPMEDIYDNLDAVENPIVGEDNYTLTDDDYEALELGFGSFSSMDDAKTVLPGFLSEKYLVWGKGSSVNVNFNLYRGRAFSVKNYSLVQADYTTAGSDLLGFDADANPAELLPAIILNKYGADDVKDGDYAGIQYYQFTPGTYTVTPTVSLDDNLDYGTSAGDLTVVSSDVWTRHSGSTTVGSSTVGYVAEGLSMTGYPSSTGGALTIVNGNSQDVNTALAPEITEKTTYISALVNITEVDEGTYFFHLMEEDGSYAYSARVGAKDDGNGKILFGIGATSSSLTYGETAYDLNTTYLLVASYDSESGLSNLHVLTSPTATEPSTPEASNTGSTGNTAKRVGIRQGGGGPTATIDGIRVANTWSAIMTNDTLDDEVIGNKESFKDTYAYADGAWSLAEGDDFYAVTEEDFTAMGISNFGSSVDPDDYMPTFLNNKFPYAAVDTQMDVVYKYVSSRDGVQTRGNIFTKTGVSTWEAYQSTIATSLNFSNDGITWVPDNTIKYTLVAEDYALVVTTLKTEPGYEAAASNLDSFSNFNRTGAATGDEPSGSSNWNDLMMTRALGIVLDNLDPNAEEGQKYTVTYSLYNGSGGIDQFRLIKTNGSWVNNN